MGHEHILQINSDIIFQQDGQCTCTVTLWRTCVTILAVEMQQCVLYFSTLSHIKHDFQKTFIEDTMCALILLYNFGLQHFLFLE